MKTLKMKTFYLVLFFIGAIIQVQAQSFFQIYKNEAERYVSDFTRPLFEASIYNFADGWGHSAQTLDPFHVKFDLMAHYSMVPENMQHLTFNPSEFQYVDVLDASNNPITSPVELPTLFGGSTNYKFRVLAPQGGGLYKRYITNVPFGIKDQFERNVNFIGVGLPAVSLQLNMGLPLGSEIGLRYLPNITMGPVEVQLFGIGIKHSISQYFKSDKESKFHLAGVIAYSGGKIAGDYDNNRGEFTVRTFNIQALGSYDMKFLTVYGGAGFVRGTSGFKLKGNISYTYDIVDGLGNQVGTMTETVTDPFDLKFSANELKFHAGLQLNLYVVRIFVQYNVQKYPGLHAGLSIKI